MRTNGGGETDDRDIVSVRLSVTPTMSKVQISLKE